MEIENRLLREQVEDLRQALKQQQAVVNALRDGKVIAIDDTSAVDITQSNQTSEKDELQSADNVSLQDPIPILFGKLRSIFVQLEECIVNHILIDENRRQQLREMNSDQPIKTVFLRGFALTPEELSRYHELWSDVSPLQTVRVIHDFKHPDKRVMRLDMDEGTKQAIRERLHGDAFEPHGKLVAVDVETLIAAMYHQEDPEDIQGAIDLIPIMKKFDLIA